MGMKNHELVPAALIQSISKLKRANTYKIIQNLLKHKLIMHKNLKFDGYALNYPGYDYLALRVFMKRGLISKIGSKFGVGKESDIYLWVFFPVPLPLQNKNFMYSHTWKKNSKTHIFLYKFDVSLSL